MCKDWGKAIASICISLRKTLCFYTNQFLQLFVCEKLHSFSIFSTHTNGLFTHSPPPLLSGNFSMVSPALITKTMNLKHLNTNTYKGVRL